MTENTRDTRYQVSADRNSATRRVRYVETNMGDAADCTLCQLDDGTIGSQPTITNQETNMKLSQDIIDEIELIALFPNDSIQEGLKIHSSAAPQRIAAAERLFNKGLISQADGGYLTSSGMQAQQQLLALGSLLQF